MRRHKIAIGLTGEPVPVGSRRFHRDPVHAERQPRARVRPQRLLHLVLGRVRVVQRALHRGDVAILVPPRDVHNHGHVAGTGPSPYSLILLGDDMLVFNPQEYDPEQGTWRALEPGDPGRANR
jgi:hypothetical protein